MSRTEQFSEVEVDVATAVGIPEGKATMRVVTCAAESCNKKGLWNQRKRTMKGWIKLSSLYPNDETVSEELQREIYCCSPGCGIEVLSNLNSTKPKSEELGGI